MRTKLIFFYIYLFFVGILLSQTKNYVIKIKSEVVGILKMEIYSSIYVKDENSKIETIPDKKAKEYQFTQGNKITFISHNNLCGEGTKEELKELNAENKNQMEYKDVEVEKTSKKMELLGHECKKAIIKYKTKVIGFEMKNESEIWYTESIKPVETNPSQENETNEYYKAVKALGGMILKQINKSNGRTSSQMEVLEYKEGVVDDSMTAINDAGKDCKKMLTLKEFFKKKRQEEINNSSPTGR